MKISVRNINEAKRFLINVVKPYTFTTDIHTLEISDDIKEKLLNKGIRTADFLFTLPYEYLINNCKLTLNQYLEIYNVLNNFNFSENDNKFKLFYYRYYIGETKDELIDQINGLECLLEEEKNIFKELHEDDYFFVEQYEGYIALIQLQINMRKEMLEKFHELKK